jgi:hypothetical protein
MLEQVEAMLSREESNDVQYDEKTASQAEIQFLDTLLAWGPTQTLLEFAKLFEYQSTHDASIANRVKCTEGSIVRRNQQSAATYLQFPSSSVALETPSSHVEVATIDTDHKQSLFNIDRMMQVVATHVSTTDIVPTQPTKVALHAMAKLCIMNAQYDDALKHFFAIADQYPTYTISQIEQTAYDVVNTVEDPEEKSPPTISNYCYLLPFIENHHLYQNLLEKGNKDSKPIRLPLLSLLTLVGLDVVGDFLIEHRVLPQTQTTNNFTQRNTKESVPNQGSKEERRGTLPIDLVAEQFSTRPKLLLWYLHIVFVRKPEVYVTFKNFYLIKLTSFFTNTKMATAKNR